MRRRGAIWHAAPSGARSGSGRGASQAAARAAGKAARAFQGIDQNPVERSIRPTKVGSRNWLFIGNPKSGWCSAVIYSIVGTCRLLGVNPEAYLTWVLPKLAAATNRTATALLPHDYAREHPPDSG